MMAHSTVIVMSICVRTELNLTSTSMLHLDQTEFHTKREKNSVEILNIKFKEKEISFLINKRNYSVVQKKLFGWIGYSLLEETSDNYEIPTDRDLKVISKFILYPRLDKSRRITAAFISELNERNKFY